MARKPVGRSWRCDETYIKVGGQWMYLYRAVDQRGGTVESHLSHRRDMGAAKAFFRKAFKHHGPPRTITLDGFEPTHLALRRMGIRIPNDSRLNHAEDATEFQSVSCPAVNLST